MWEMCISAKNQAVFEFLYKKIQVALSQFCIITKHTQVPYFFVSLACEDYDVSRTKLFLSEIVCDCICTIYKKDFLMQKLALPVKDGVYVKALNKALVGFDRETDAYIVAKALKLEKMLDLDGFYYFALKSLRDKWQELACIANDNGYFLLTPENFVDLLRFLVDNLEIASGTVNVYVDDNGFRILDELDKAIAVEDDDLLSSLIGLSPKRINFHGDISAEKYLLVSQVFDKRIVCV